MTMDDPHDALQCVKNISGTQKGHVARPVTQLALYCS